MMGIGHTFFEQMVYEDGQLLNPGLIDYRVPTMADLPPNFAVSWWKMPMDRDHTAQRALARAA